MIELLAILGAIILGIVSNAAWDMCKTVYRKRNDYELSLLKIFKHDQIQTLGLSAALLKKSTNRTNMELKRCIKILNEKLKDSTTYIPGSYSRATYIGSKNEYDIDIVALTHPDNDYFKGLILAPHHGSQALF